MKPVKQKRIIKTRNFSDYKHSNITERHIIHHDRDFVVEHFVTEQLRNSIFFFVKTAKQWNHLDPVLQPCY